MRRNRGGTGEGGRAETEGQGGTEEEERQRDREKLRKRRDREKGSQGGRGTEN